MEHALHAARSIAVLGIKPESRRDRDAHQIPLYLQKVGYAILPVPIRYPEATRILGVPVRRHLTELPRPIDILNVFCKPADFAPHIAEVLIVRPSVVWFQSGLLAPEAARALLDAGLPVAEDCIGCRRAMLTPSWAPLEGQTGPSRRDEPVAPGCSARMIPQCPPRQHLRGTVGGSTAGAFGEEGHWPRGSPNRGSGPAGGYRSRLARQRESAHRNAPATQNVRLCWRRKRRIHRHSRCRRRRPLKAGNERTRVATSLLLGEWPLLPSSLAFRPPLSQHAKRHNSLFSAKLEVLVEDSLRQRVLKNSFGVDQRAPGSSPEASADRRYDTGAAVEPNLQVPDRPTCRVPPPHRDRLRRTLLR